MRFTPGTTIPPALALLAALTLLAPAPVGAGARTALAFALALLLSFALHELGHWAGGAAAGMRFLSLRAGPLHLRRTDRGIRPGWNHDWGSFAVQVSTPRTVSGLRGRVAVSVAGGPLASGVTSLVALALLRSDAVAPAGTFAATLAQDFAAVSILLVALNLLPIRWGGFPSDGAALLMLARNGPDARALLSVVALTSRAVAGDRPAEWPACWVVEAEPSPPEGRSTVRTFAALLAYYHALDRGDAALAAHRLEDARKLAREVPELRSDVAAEAAYLAARLNGDADEARRRLAEANGGAGPESLLRAEAALRLLENDPDGAMRCAERALRLLDDGETGPYPGIVVAERAWLHELLAEAEQRSGDPYAREA